MANKGTQLQKLERVLRYWRTAWEAQQAIGSTTISKRISEARAANRDRFEQRPMPTNPRIFQYRIKPAVAV